MRISSSGHVYIGAERQSYQFDGNSNAYPTDVQRFGLIRFDGIFGTEPGQIPPGATILSATLEFTTCTIDVSTEVGSGGPLGVARLLVPFDVNTVWSTAYVTPENGKNSPFGDNGPDFAGGEFDRPTGGWGSTPDMAPGVAYSAPITSIVQDWCDGQPNHGMIILCETTDAWFIRPTGYSDPALRPKLVVEYEPARVETRAFQQGVNDYSGTSMIYLQQGGVTDFGQNITAGQWLEADATQRKVALIKFDDIFGPGPNQVPPGADIVKAFVTVTTRFRTDSAGWNPPSKGPFFIHRMLVDYDWTGTDISKPFFFEDFLSGDGPTEADGEIGPALSEARGMLGDSRVWFDVTAAVEAWQGGAPNQGLCIDPGTTTDGWKINWLGSEPADLRPQLVVLFENKGADFDGDGDVDLADFGVFQGCFNGPNRPAAAANCGGADFDGDNDVDLADFGFFQGCFNGPNRPAACG